MSVSIYSAFFQWKELDSLWGFTLADTRTCVPHAVQGSLVHLCRKHETGYGTSHML